MKFEMFVKRRPSHSDREIAVHLHFLFNKFFEEGLDQEEGELLWLITNFLAEKYQKRKIYRLTGFALSALLVNLKYFRFDGTPRGGKTVPIERAIFSKWFYSNSFEYYGMRGKYDRVSSLQMMKYVIAEKVKFQPKRFVGVGYKDKGSIRKKHEDGSPGWQEVAMHEQREDKKLVRIKIFEPLAPGNLTVLRENLSVFA